MKKTLSMLLASSMILSVFTGCSSGGDTTSAGGGDYSQAVGGADDDSIYTAPGEFPIFKEESDYISVSIFGPDRSGVNDYSIANNATTAWFAETTGITLNFETALEVDMQQKFNTLMIGQDYPELVCYTGISLAEQLLYGSQGTFIPLNDLIKNYMPNLTAMLDKYPGAWESITMSDGNIYNMPQIGANLHSTSSYKMWINQTWLDNLGLDMPTTTEQFKEVLIAFRDQDANGNGNPNDEVPMSGSLSGWNNDPMPFLVNSFGPFQANVNNSNQVMFDSSGELYYT